MAPGAAELIEGAEDAPIVRLPVAMIDSSTAVVVVALVAMSGAPW